MRRRLGQHELFGAFVVPRLPVQLRVRLPQPRRLLELVWPDPLCKVLGRHETVVRPHHVRLRERVVGPLPERFEPPLRLPRLKEPLKAEEKEQSLQLRRVSDPRKLTEGNALHVLHLPLPGPKVL